MVMNADLFALQIASAGRRRWESAGNIVYFHSFLGEMIQFD